MSEPVSISSIAAAKAWAQVNLQDARAKLEIPFQAPDASQILRGRIATLKDFLAALENPVPPVWTDGSEDPSE